MHESFLHYLWKYKKFSTLALETVQGETIKILRVGDHNDHSGPDFFNAQLEIDGQLWAGNVEVHSMSSHWYIHNHEQDIAYQNVILHVVWEHDTEIFTKDNTPIPTLVLKDFVDIELLNKYQDFSSHSGKWIPCEKDFSSIDDFLLNNWLERLYIERLERKSHQVETLLQESKNNWEAVLFILLAKNFGLKVNGEAFTSLAKSLDWSVVSKITSNINQLEAVFFGQAGLLKEDCQEPFYLELQKEYHYLRHKFSLQNHGVLPFQFFKLRPPNFPTIRLAQFATLYSRHPNLFSKIIDIKTIEEAYKLFSVSVSPFWKTHYTFKSTSKPANKQLTKSFVNLLFINTIIPLQYSYAKYLGKQNGEELMTLASTISPERNSIVDKFNTLKPLTSSAMHSQALIQLKTEYCSKLKCLDCAIGNSLLKGNN